MTTTNIRMPARIRLFVLHSWMALPPTSKEKMIHPNFWASGEAATRKEFLAVIRAEFAAIHKTIAKIEAVEKVPLSDVPEAMPIDLEFLQRLANEGREKLPVQAGNQIIDVIAKEVLSRIETTRKTEVNIYGDVDDSTLLAGDKGEIKNAPPEKKSGKRKQ